MLAALLTAPEAVALAAVLNSLTDEQAGRALVNNFQLDQFKKARTQVNECAAQVRGGR